jgi:hypothetical protein
MLKERSKHSLKGEQNASLESDRLQNGAVPLVKKCLRPENRREHAAPFLPFRRERRHLEK